MNYVFQELIVSKNIYEMIFEGINISSLHIA